MTAGSTTEEFEGMQPEHSHPSDEQLFDYTGGLLTRAQSAAVEAHLAACAHCAASVHAALSAAPGLQSGVTAGGRQMPAAAAARMHEAIAAEFQLRSPGRIAAAAARPAADGGWRRWLVPALAFAMLAALAGVSAIGLDGDGGATSGGVPTQQSQGDAKTSGGVEAETAQSRDDESATRSAKVEELPRAEAPATVAPETAGAPLEAPGAAQGASAPATADSASSADGDTGLELPDGGEGTSADVVPVEPPADDVTGSGEVAPNNGDTPPDPGNFVPSTQPGALGDNAGGVPGVAEGAPVAPANAPLVQVCAVSFDGTTPLLPSGLVPSVVTEGPFGIVVACA